MINTDYTTLLVTFTNTSRTVIFNTTMRSMLDTVEHIRYNGYIVDTIKEYSHARQRFVVVSKSMVRIWCDHCKALDSLLESQKF